MPKVIFEQVEQCFNPFLLEEGAEFYADFCRKTARELDEFIDDNYYIREIIIMVQAEIDTIALHAENRLVAICYFWRKLQQLMRPLEIALEFYDGGNFVELETAYYSAVKIFNDDDYIYSRRENQ